MEEYLKSTKDLPELETIGFTEIDSDENIILDIKEILKKYPDIQYIETAAYNNYSRCGDIDYTTVELIFKQTKTEK